MPNKIIYSWERVPVIFDLRYASCLIGMNTEVLRRITSKGEFPAFKVGKQWRVKKEDLLAWIDKQKVGQA